MSRAAKRSVHEAQLVRTWGGFIRYGLALVAIARAASLQAGAPPREMHSPRVSVDVAIAPARGSLSAHTLVRPGKVESGTKLVFLLSRSLSLHGVTAGRHAIVTSAPTDEPFPGLQQIAVHFTRAVEDPVISFRYAGQPHPGGSRPINQISAELVELSLDGMWLPIKSDLSLPFAVDARISGLPTRAVVVAQGSVSRSGRTFFIHRDVRDVDLAFVASTRFQKLQTPDFELIATDLTSPAATIYRTHGPHALRFLETWLGPMPGRPARIAIVRRERHSGYARTGYIVLTEANVSDPVGQAKFIAHEFAHSWFRNASAAGEHRWLDESIAEYVAVQYVEKALGADARNSILAPKFNAAASAGAIVGRDRSDRELYSKGVVLLTDLERRIGRKAVDALIQRVALQH